MKIAIASDVHLEFGNFVINNDENADILILAGDITTVVDIDKHLDFFENCSKQFQNVFYILGNHEYYGGCFLSTCKIIQDKLAAFSNIIVRDQINFHLDQENVTFIGNTMWTDVDRRNPLLIQKIKRAMNDFRMIENLDIETMICKNEQFVNYVRDYMSEYRKQEMSHKIVVVTHHAPSFESIHEKFRTPSTWDYNYAFASNHANLMIDNPEIVLWVHGHMHDPFDYTLGNTRVVCNPRGYIGYEERAKDYTVKYVEI